MYKAYHFTAAFKTYMFRNILFINIQRAER